LALSIGVLKETFPGERRVALAPKAMDVLTKAGAEVWVETGAGDESGFPDAVFIAKGAKIAANAAELREKAQVLLTVRTPEPAGMKPGHVVIGLCDPLSQPQLAAQYAAAGTTLFSMELVPRTTRAQSMDVLSSMASVAGYKAVLIAASTLPRLFPMMTTAAGTVPPAKVLVLGAGVAGLQAIATARRLGAVVFGYDVRAAVKEQIESLGAKFVSITMGASGEGQGGYARALTDEEIRSQREQMAEVLKDMDVVITTAAVPGRKAPILITAEMARVMSPGSVIVDIAAERGGNCELTQAGATIVDQGVTIVGALSLPSTVPNHSSQMYGRNIVTFLKNMLTKEGALNIDTNDDITRDTLVVRDGQIVNARVQELLGVAVQTNS
jgi:proton-translocating NAD(P)+ transhydrogenase subunit alpha